MEHFFPRIEVKTKKKIFTKNGTLFSPAFKWRLAFRCTPESNFWDDADEDHTQIIGGDTVKLLGGYITIPPGFGTPAARDGADNKKYNRMLRCVRKPCPHAAPHRIQMQLSSRYTASYLFLKFPQTSEKI